MGQEHLFYFSQIKYPPNEAGILFVSREALVGLTCLAGIMILALSVPDVLVRLMDV